MSTPITKPAPDEHNPYFTRYVDLVPGVDLMPSLGHRPAQLEHLLAGLGEARARHRYAEGKWSVKEVVQHVSDCERVFAYRALRFGRADATPLPGFDENAWAPFAAADARTLTDLVAEFAAVRAATVALFASFDGEAPLRRGEANGSPMSVRALGWVIAGHERHHVNVLRERYGLGG